MLTTQLTVCSNLYNVIDFNKKQVGALHAVQQRKPLTAGALIALGAHSKIFPAMYALPILLFMDASYNTPEAKSLGSLTAPTRAAWSLRCQTSGTTSRSMARSCAYGLDVSSGRSTTGARTRSRTCDESSMSHRNDDTSCKYI